MLAAARSPEDRIGAFMAYAFDFIRSHPCRPLFESESGFVMSYLLDHLPSLRGELVLRLGDALDTVPAVAAGALDREQLADVIVRLFASSWIIPESDDASLVQSVNRILQISIGVNHMESDMETETRPTTGYGEHPLTGMDPDMAANPQPIFKLLRDEMPVMSIDMPLRPGCAAVAQGGHRLQPCGTPRSSPPTWTRSTSRTSGP